MESGSGAGTDDAFAASTAPLTWQDFLERMRQRSAGDIVKSIKSFLLPFTKRTPDPEKDSAYVQEFLVSMEEAFRAHPLWADSSEEELESAGEGLEKYVTTKLFNHVFASVPEDANRDDELHEKMALLQQFIRPENLDVKPSLQNETSWLLAQKELQKINMYKAPRDKLVCILNCCKVINNLLINASIASNDDPPGADEFLPVLIYVIIKANPPQLHSNLLYIQRYRRQSRLVSEAAYFFTNVLSAESFIWNIDAQALSMDEAEFHRKMESAKAHLLGQSTNIDDKKTEADLDVMEQRLGISKVHMGFDDSLSTREYSAPLQPYDTSNDLGRRDKPPSKTPSISDLEKSGATELAKDNNVSKYFQEFTFLYARAGDLTVEDVDDLLNSYKQLALRYVSLARGMGVDHKSFAETNVGMTKLQSGKEYGVMTDMETKYDKHVDISSTKETPYEETISAKDEGEKKEGTEDSVAEEIMEKDAEEQQVNA